MKARKWPIMTKSSIWILNGPNLNRVGTRQTEIYGSGTLAEAEINCRALLAPKGIDLVFRQTNCEGMLIDWIHEADQGQGLIINGGALSHTSIGVMDALFCLIIPIYEVHISQVYKRESFRQQSYISQVAKGILSGFGIYGYVLALQALLENDLNLRSSR